MRITWSASSLEHAKSTPADTNSSKDAGTSLFSWVQAQSSILKAVFHRIFHKAPLPPCLLNTVKLPYKRDPRPRKWVSYNQGLLYALLLTWKTGKSTKLFSLKCLLQPFVSCNSVSCTRCYSSEFSLTIQKNCPWWPSVSSNHCLLCAMWLRWWTWENQPAHFQMPLITIFFPSP